MGRKAAPVLLNSGKVLPDHGAGEDSDGVATTDSKAGCIPGSCPPPPWMQPPLTWHIPAREDVCRGDAATSEALMLLLRAVANEDAEWSGVVQLFGMQLGKAGCE